MYEIKKKKSEKVGNQRKQKVRKKWEIRKNGK